MLAFLHPWAHGGGGGEAVLWVCVAESLRQGSHVNVFCQTNEGDVILRSVWDSDIRRELQEAHDSGRLFFTRLLTAGLLRETRTFTMGCLALASVMVALELVCRRCSRTVVDLAGVPFSYPLLWLCGRKTFAYVHYPWIQDDMRDAVLGGIPSVNNRGWGATARLRVFVRAKLFYYDTLAMLYGFMGFFAEAVAVNGTWTYQRLRLPWFLDENTIVWPPVDVASVAPVVEGLVFDDSGRDDAIVMVGEETYSTLHSPVSG